MGSEIDKVRGGEAVDGDDGEWMRRRWEQTTSHVDRQYTHEMLTMREGGSALRDKALWVTWLVSEVSAYTILTLGTGPTVLYPVRVCCLTIGTSSMYGISSFKFFYQCCFVRTLNSCRRGLLGLLYILGCCGGTVLDEIDEA